MTLSGNTNFSLTTSPWSATGVTASDLLARVKGELSYLASTQNSDGSFTDQYGGPGGPSAGFAYSAAVLASTGDTTYLAQAIEAMDHAASAYATGTNQPEFLLPYLVKSYMVFKSNSLASSSELSTWASEISTLKYTTAFADGNWSTHAMEGAWLQYNAGLVSHSTAVSEIEGLWSQYQAARENLSNDGLYVDGYASPPSSLSVEAVGRGGITALIAEGYDGPSAAAMQSAILAGGQASLLLQDSDGQAPTGGRTDDHVWVDAGYEAIDQTLANMNASSNPALASQYQRAADIAFTEMSRWQNSDGSFQVTKNEFSPSDRVGYQIASNYFGYNDNLMALTADAYRAKIANPNISEAPAPSEVGGYVFTTSDAFQATVANAGGTEVEIETLGRSALLNGQTWSALGIDRIGATGWDTRLGPSDGIYDASSGQGITFAPEWLQNGSWTRLASHPNDYSGTVTTQLTTPVLTELTVTWSGSGPTFTEHLTITPDGILSQTTESGSGQFGMTLPLLADDGRTTMTQVIGNRIASTAYPGGTSAENFLALNSGTTLTNEGSMQSTYGDLTAVRAVSSSSEQDTFAYQSSAGDPSASSVLSSFNMTATGYTSNLGWVNGTLYSGRTSAGGYGNSIALSGSGTPDVTFSKPVNFILQVKNGSVTSIEADSAVTATVGGKAYNLAATVPMSVTGGSGPASVTLTSGGNSVTGGTGLLTVTDTHGGNTITGGSGGLNLTVSAGGDVITTSVSATTTSNIILGIGADTVTANGTTNIIPNHANLTVSGNGDLSINGGMGSITLIGGAGSEYVFTQTGTKNLLTLGSGKDAVLSHGADTINAGAGADRIYAGGAALVNGGSGLLSVSGHSGAITVNGGTGAVHATAGSGGGYIKGGSNGGNALSASAGNTTLVGGGNGDTLTDSSTSGSNALIAGPGSETLTGGTGAADLFVLTKSSVTHDEVIQGFTPGPDHLHFAGFGATQPIASQTVVGGNLQLTLADNAHVTLIGITSLGSGAVV